MIGLLGKTPSQPDFLRLHASSTLTVYLHRWLEAAAAAMKSKGAPLTGAVQFIFTAPGEKNALVGVLAPSVDKVGREFPLVLFSEQPAAPLAKSFSLAPAAFRPFFLSATALLRAASEGMDAAELAKRLAVLPAPGESGTASAELLRQAMLAERRCAELLEPVIKGTGAEGRYYALHTFLIACAGERHREKAAAGVVVDCPLAPGLGPIAWLEMAAVRLRWAAVPPAFAWIEGDRPRLLLSLGAPPTTLLAHLAEPDKSGANLWALSTSRPAALANARKALGSAIRQVLDSPDATVGELLRTLSR